MDRRKSLKIMALTALSGGVLVEACKPSDKKAPEVKAPPRFNIDRFPEEKANDEKLMAEKFFNDHEIKTITILGDIIIPADEVSGSASDARVHEFIEFIVKDRPEFQTPMRGGLKWLDVQCFNRYGKSFIEATPNQQIELVDQIAFPEKAKAEMKQGVSFFNLMRNLTAVGFYTSEIGIKDIGYVGNTPNKWAGVPDDVLKQYGLQYTEKELKECI